MDGIHDMGGRRGFGAVRREADVGPFHERWEARVFAMVMLLTAAGVFVPDTFRHAVESLPEAEYLGRGYYGRWLRALERLLLHAAVVSPEDIAARDPAGEPAATDPPAVAFAPAPAAPVVTSQRTVTTPPRFALGQSVRARDLRPAGHTRLPAYVRGHRGIVERIQRAWVFPDTHAHGLGEDPQHVYAVRFGGEELWGAQAEPGTSVCVDLFERYLEAVAA